MFGLGRLFFEPQLLLHVADVKLGSLVNAVDGDLQPKKLSELQAALGDFWDDLYDQTAIDSWVTQQVGICVVSVDSGLVLVKPQKDSLSC